MRTVTATEASRHFSELLDAIESGQTVTVTRGNRPVAEIRPPRRRTGRDLREALAALAPLDGDFAATVSEVVRDLNVPEESDPWADD